MNQCIPFFSVKNDEKKFPICLVGNLKVSTFASAIERDTP